LVWLLATWPALLAAQSDSANTITWEVGSPKAGWCIHFLMEPKTAAEGLARGQRLVLARDATGLPPALARVIRDEPQYGDWAPAELCTYIAEAFWVDGRRFDSGERGHPIAALYWGIGSTSAEGSSTDRSGMSLRVLATNSGGMRRAMEMRRVPIDRVQIEVLPVKESTDEQYFLKLEGATIVFIGHTSPDSTLPKSERSRTATITGDNRTVWNVDFRFHPGEVAGMAGALRILGKRNLAKALDRSPIRLLSPVISGGRGTVTFTH
jgi:hypothetical protein